MSANESTDLISSFTILPNGIPVHSEITEATACESTSGKNIGLSPCNSFKALRKATRSSRFLAFSSSDTELSFTNSLRREI